MADSPRLGRALRTRKAPAPHREFTRDPLWYKDAVIYQLHVKSFFDANNDGIGDFAGLAQKLGYIHDLGVNTLWLLPFYPSPRRDDGYDIAAYKAVHPDYGALRDVRRFVKAAHRRGLRVITELVINHTSDQHPWFQRARRAKPGSKARDFYVWSDTDTRYSGTRVIFCDSEKSNWTWDEAAKAYYWHRFYSHQPDLNFDNPAVVDAVLSVMRFWLDLGVDGLRLDAVPYLIEREGTNNENLPETHAILKRIRAELEHKYPDRMLLAEANQWPEDVRHYFGGTGAPDVPGDECHMAFHFPLMPRMYMALAQEDRFPITDILRQTPDIPGNCQWAIFLRNHDELTLEMVTDRERDYLWQVYAADKRARINLGIRKRLAPLVERDRRRIELLNSLLLSMPGTPVIYYGDEIGMGNNIFLGDRDGVRTPMQWSLDRNAGFSRADPASLVLPPLMDPLYGYQAVNVESQATDPHSLLNWTRRMLAIRKRFQAFGRGTMRLLYPGNRRVLAYLREWTSGEGRKQTILCVANVSRTAQAVELDLAAQNGCVPVEMLGGSAFPPIGQLPYLLTLPPFGFYWFQIVSHQSMPEWHVPQPEPMPDLRTLVLQRDLAEVLSPPAKDILERDLLPPYFAKRRWYAHREAPSVTRVVSHAALPGADAPLLLTEIEAVSPEGTSRYQLPLGIVPESETTSALPHQLALARVRRRSRLGFLTDAFALDALARRMIALLKSRASAPASDGQLRFIPEPALADLDLPVDAEIRRVGAEQSNSSLVLADKAILKIIRRLVPGQHPESEMGRYLTSQGYTQLPPLLGEVVRIAADGTPHTLALLQGHIHNQGDGWGWTLNLLRRALEDEPLPNPQAASAARGDPIAEYARFASTLGRRLGEMHATLARPAADPAFAPARASEAQARAWADETCATLKTACALLAARKEWPNAADGKAARKLCQRAADLCALAQRAASHAAGTLTTRIHGDFHLGQVLVAQDDVFLIDFEGEPVRSLDERRALSSPLRDVAGMLRSFEYAAASAARSLAEAQAGMASARREDFLVRFARVARDEFLKAWRAAAPAVAGDAHLDELLRLFMLQKGAGEIVYEAGHRPDWLGVPLAGLEALLEERARG